MKQKISEKQFIALENEIWKQYLNSASQEDIYYSLLTFNWDSNAYFLHWLIDNPNTDKAIILTAYWMSEPYFAKQFKDRKDVQVKMDWYIDDFDFIERLEKRYCKGFYTTTIFECDPKNVEHLEEYNALADWTLFKGQEKLVRTIPQIMFEKISGTPIKPVDYSAYTEGLPNSYYEKLEELDNSYEIEY